MEDYKAVLFDLDGTLVDTAPDFVIAANALRARHHLEPLPAHEIRPVVSNGSAAVTETALSLSRQDSDFEPNREILLLEYLKVLGQKSQLFSHLDDMLKQLESADIPWGIVTNKPVLYAEPLLKALELDHRCSALICPDHVKRSKPDPEGILLAIKMLDRGRGAPSPSECLYVGDHIRDIQAGAAAGCDTIGVGFGYIAEDDDPESWQSDYLATTTKDLATLVCAMLLP